MPIGLVTFPLRVPTPVTTLANLAATGQFIPPLHGQDQVGFAPRIGTRQEKWDGLAPRPEREFSHSDGQIILFISWNPKTKLKGVAVARFYNLDNHEMANHAR